MRKALVGLLVAGLLAAPMSYATVITYNFTAEGGHSGSFSFDDSNTTTVAPPSPITPGGSFYNAINVTFDGTAVASPVIGIYDDVLGTHDCIFAASALGAFMPGYIQLCADPPTLFSGQALSVANNLQLSDFNGPNYLTLGGPTFDILTLTSAAAPEPGTLALLVVSLAGLGFARRRQLFYWEYLAIR